MDAQIRRLVVTGAESNDIQLLSDAFQKLQQNFQVNLVQSKDTIGQDIYVLLAESALDLNADSIADECLQMFFSLSPVRSQFVGRAYLCQFRMYMPKAAQDFGSLNNAIPFLQKCLSFAAVSPRYQFLVYNASVIYFNYIRPFFRTDYRKYLCDSFQQVIDTMINITDEKDYPWQAQLLFELVRCYMDANNITKARETSEPEYLLEVRLIQAEYMIKSLGENEQLYSKSSVETRIRAIELTEETVESLIRTGEFDLVQTGCVNLWNLCLPLLQTNLRGRIRKALTTLVNILERIQSLDWLLRSQAHFELAKIEEDIEQLDSAKNNLLKAKYLDDTSIYASRINLALERLHLRSELYKT
ncbi:unnamed protein product, partial [Rotaria magnacalcarata]